MFVSHNQAELSAASNDEVKEDRLRICLESVKEYCKAKGLTLFHGYFEDHPGGTARWEGTEADGWRDYVDAFIASGSKLLLYSCLEYGLKEEELQDFASDELPLLPEEDQAAFRSAWSKMQGRRGHLASFDLHFLHEGVCFTYRADAAWYYTFDYLFDLITGSIDDGDDEEEENEQSGEQRLNSEEVEKWARELLGMGKYLEAKTPRDRRQVARMEILEKGIVRPDSRYLITERAEDIYQTEILPQKQEALRLQVEELAARNFTKIKAAKELKISMTELNKYWP